MSAEYIPIVFGDRPSAIQRVTVGAANIKKGSLFDEKH